MFITVNGIKLFYEKTGRGRPVILIHGNSEDHGKLQGVANLLAGRCEVYAIDSRCHGQSGKTDTLHYNDMAEDVAQFIQALGLHKPLIIGSSDGAIVGLLVAIHHPDLSGALISAGANRNPGELKAWFRAVARLGLWGTKGDPKMALMLNEPDITDDMLAKIKIPVLVMAGQRDILAQRHTRALAAAISGASLCILPGETHSSYIKHADRLIAAARSFIDDYLARSE